MKRLLAMTCLMFAVFSGLGLTSHGAALAATGGNADAAHACQQSGYLTLHGSDGTTFKNEGQCVSYVARGGTISGVTACTVSSTTGCLTFDNTLLSSQLGTGNTINVTGSFSFVDGCDSTGFCQPSLPNNLATGGGTYVEKDSSGKVISSGIIRVADTAGYEEGLLFVYYLDTSDVPQATCSAGTGVRIVEVQATLIDSSTGATDWVSLGADTGAFEGPVGAAYTGTDAYAGLVPTSAIAC
jgi:hypothetical protein